MTLPAHLKRYIVEQDYSRYTPVDQEVWRYIMRQLTDFLSQHAYPCYMDGLRKTGIEVDRIPHINSMSEKLEKFGWQAIPVSGFIPPAAFMELQAHGFLPIASDMRSVDHLMYTPAPDIVHEAAGHAPILVDPEFAAYLKAYAQVASRAIISSEDMEQYEAIRVLSDAKESPDSTPEDVKKAEERLNEANASISHLSEAALLGRMNWWTAEYGLIGDINSPRIFGAGLLSSVGEAKSCLDPKVKKIPLTVDCIQYGYDITEPQPQLFVTPDFNRLTEVLEELANQMAFRQGGTKGLEKAKMSKTPNTVQLNSGIQISGVLTDFKTTSKNEVAYIQFTGPSQLCEDRRELPNHGTSYHAHGFGSPVGFIEGSSKCLSEMTDAELERLGIRKNSEVRLKFQTGAEVRGTVIDWLRGKDGKLLIISFKNCTVTRLGETLFEPAWGTFDMAVGSKVSSVFGGPADRLAYGETVDFVAKVIPRKQWSPLMQKKHGLYTELRQIREGIRSGQTLANQETSDQLNALLEKLESDFPSDWLLRLGLYELSEALPSAAWKPRVEAQLKALSDQNPVIRANVQEGIRVLKSQPA